MKKHTVDLHGCSASKAEIVIKDTIQRCKESKEQKTRIVFITGRGNHSPNQIPVIKPMFLQMMQEQGIQVHSHNEGSFSVHVKILLKSLSINKTRGGEGVGCQENFEITNLCTKCN